MKFIERSPGILAIHAGRWPNIAFYWRLPWCRFGYRLAICPWLIVGTRETT